MAIYGGRAIDPKAGLDGIGDVAIEGDKIAAISDFPMEGGVTTRPVQWCRGNSLIWIPRQRC
ncbi:hypothetical protein [Tropicimonas sediminicola]|uniref:hypothetical protein n=1 Tax=Tropicimonas sediminicola TaxID=1031541 RepID=UPI001130072F|nr:hypothetical protein [Tropicimonas sediminicola]